MTSVLTPTGTIETLADLLVQLGSISPERVRFRPLPGTATETDVLDVHAREGRLCELVDGVLVEKGMGFRESFLIRISSKIVRRQIREWFSRTLSHCICIDHGTICIVSQNRPILRSYSTSDRQLPNFPLFRADATQPPYRGCP